MRSVVSSKAAIELKEEACCCQSLNVPALTSERPHPFSIHDSDINTSWSASGKGSGLRTNAFNQQEIEVVAPMPIARVSTATAVKPGYFSTWRRANLRSFIPQCLHGIDFGRATSWQPAGQEGDRGEHQRHSDQGGWVARLNAEKECPEHTRQR